MKEKGLAIIPYALVLAVDFYLLPIFIQDTGSAMFMMLYIIPLVALFCSIAYGVRQGFDFLLPLLAMILFLPTVFIYYNDSALVYVLAYGAVTLIGNGIGSIFHKKR